MNLSQILKLSLIKQDISSDSYDEIPFNVHLLDGIDYFFCFLLEETEAYLIVAESTLQGTEEVRIIKKDRIISIDICYDVSIFLNNEETDFNGMYV